MTPPRISPPGSIQFISHRTVRGEFAFRPDPQITQNVLYLLGYMQQRYSIDYHTASLLSNHMHLLATDKAGDQIQPFNQHFFSLLGRSTNCFRGRTENLLSTRKPNCVLVAPRAEDVIDKSAYIIVNPVEAELVSHAKKWSGLRILASQMGRLELPVRRPRFFYDENGALPEEVVVRFTMPKVWDEEPDALRERIARECNLRERAVRERVQRSDRTFLGAKRVLRKSVSSSPKTPLEGFDLVPTVACKDRSLRSRLLQWKKERQQQYQERRQAMLGGARDVVFPEGTYALHFRAGQAREPWRGCIWSMLASEP